MRRLLVILFISVLVISCATQSIVKENYALTNSITNVINNLDNAEFKPVRQGWKFDYGLSAGTGLLNTYEYLRSIYSYESLQSALPIQIFIKGPHSKTDLNLKEPYEFGYYNPEFVRLFSVSIEKLMSNELFVSSTKDSVKKYGLIDKLERLDLIYRYIQNNRTEFNIYRADYQRMLRTKTWPKDGYRDFMPEIFDKDLYWNWSETVYYFWVRRDIDGTADLWSGIIKNILVAYKQDINEYDCCYSEELLGYKSNLRRPVLGDEIKKFYSIVDNVHKHYYEPVRYDKMFNNATLAILNYSGLGENQLNIDISDLNDAEKNSNKKDNQDKASKLFNKVLDKIIELEPNINHESLVRAAIEGALTDIEARYIKANIAESLFKKRSKPLASVGLMVRKIRDEIVIVNTVKNSPAREKGLRSGYVIVTINHEEAKNDNVSEIMYKLYGSPGSIVYMSVKDPYGDIRYLSMRRRVIKASDIETRLESGNIGYLKFNLIRTGLSGYLDNVLEEIANENKKDLKGLILDFRNVSYGEIKEAVKVADIFIDEGVLINLKGSTPSGDIVVNATSSNSVKWIKIPIVILINKETSTTGEIVVSAMQDNGRALVVGTKTRGLGRPLNVIFLDSGDALIIATKTYIRADNSPLSDIGVYPDICAVKGKVFRVTNINREKCVDEPEYFKFDVTSTELKYALKYLNEHPGTVH